MKSVNNKADAILSADWHLWDKPPVCRQDDYMKTQERKYAFIRELQSDNNDCPILVAGDIFTHWKPNPYTSAWALDHFPDNIVCIAGQHDLPNHNYNNIGKSGLQILVNGDKVHLLDSSRNERDVHITDTIKVYGFPYGSNLDDLPKIKTSSKRQIALIHHLVYYKEEPFPGASKSGGNAASITKKLVQFDTIVSGDNHQTFTYEKNGTLLVNPGPILRTTAAQIDFHPCVFLYYADTNTVKKIPIPINKRAVSKIHILTKQEQDERMISFVSQLKTDIEIGLSFKRNMQNYIAKNDVADSIKSIIGRSMDYDGTNKAT